MDLEKENVNVKKVQYNTTGEIVRLPINSDKNSHQYLANKERKKQITLKPEPPPPFFSFLLSVKPQPPL